MTPLSCGIPCRLRPVPHGAKSPTRRGLCRIAAFMFGALAAFGFVYAATTWSMRAKLEEAATIISNRAAKRDRLDDMYSLARPVQRTFRQHTQMLPSAKLR